MKNNWQLKPGDKFGRPNRHKVRPLQRVLRTPRLFSIADDNVSSSSYYALSLVTLATARATIVVLGIAGVLFVFTALSCAEEGKALSKSTLFNGSKLELWN